MNLQSFEFATRTIEHHRKLLHMTEMNVEVKKVLVEDCSKLKSVLNYIKKEGDHGKTELVHTAGG